MGGDRGILGLWLCWRLKLEEKTGIEAVLGPQVVEGLCHLNCFCFNESSAICSKCECSVKCAPTHQRLYVSRLQGSPGEGLDSVAGLVIT